MVALWGQCKRKAFRRFSHPVIPYQQHRVSVAGPAARAGAGRQVRGVLMSLGLVWGEEGEQGTKWLPPPASHSRDIHTHSSEGRDGADFAPRWPPSAVVPLPGPSGCCAAFRGTRSWKQRESLAAV